MTKEVRDIVDEWLVEVYGSQPNGITSPRLYDLATRIEAAVLAPYKTRTETAWPHDEIQKEKITMKYVDTPTAGMPSDERTHILELALHAGFMLNTAYGQEKHLLMPVSDSETLLKFAQAVRAECQAEMERKQREAFEAGWFARNELDEDKFDLRHDTAVMVKNDFAAYLSQTGKEK